MERAVFAGGCFWGMQDLIRRLPGVSLTRVGYTGGTVPNATYEKLKRGNTGHAESIEVFFDPAKLSYRQLLEFFFRSTIRQPRTGRAMTVAALTDQKFSMLMPLKTRRQNK